MKKLVFSLLTAIAPSLAVAQATQVDSVLTGDINSNLHLSADKVYRLDGVVWVNRGATLTIEPGTVVVAQETGAGTVSALVVNRGGKLIADGRADRPIVFTSARPAGERRSGDWGGIVLLGEATTNHPAGAAAIEGGIADAQNGPNAKGWFGGTNDDDNSGTLRYVRIEFAGYAAQPNTELNSLTMGAIGRGTTIENIQVAYANDDAYEWFGGTVNGRNLIATSTLDDDFDTDNGFRGRVQFGLVKRDPQRADISRSQSFESDNNSQGAYNAPFTSPVFSNVTSIGPVADLANQAGNQYSDLFGAAIQIRRNSRTSIFNSVFVGWPAGLDMENSEGRGAANTANAALADSIQIRNNDWYGVNRVWRVTPPTPLTEAWISTGAFNNKVEGLGTSGAVNDFAKMANPFEMGDRFDPRPRSNAPYLTGAAYTASGVVRIDDPYFERVDFKGAFPNEGPRRRWDLPWANYSPEATQYAKLDKSTPVDSVITGDINGNLTLSASKIYRLDGVVWVNRGATLTVEPGTVVVAQETEAGTVSALVVNRGGKLIADGTASRPIVFTSARPAGERRSGDWGGIVLLGEATTNHPAGAAAIEGGIADAQNSPNAKGWFGGTNDDDNSGTLRYVRIEFAGYAAQPNTELNSLTMGAVGRGTTIENIHVAYANDDAYEWFGGTVNAKHLVATATLDDDLDTDNGFRGKVQHVLVKRDPQRADISRSQSFESDNNSQGAYNAPFTTPVFSNVTSIGPVRNLADQAGNQYSDLFGAAIQIRRNSRTSIFNSVFIGWPAGLDMENSEGRGAANTANAALADSIQIRNNDWYGVNRVWRVTPPAPLTEAWISTAAFNNKVEGLGNAGVVAEIAKVPGAFGTESTFNPTPAADAAFLTGAAYNTAGVVNIGDPFFDKVDYKGAFPTSGARFRWDLPWVNYDPVFTIYRPEGTQTSVVDDEGNEIPALNTLNARVFPNPVQTQAVVRYNLPAVSNVTVEVFDVMGNKVATLVDGATQREGIWEVDFNTRSMSAGVYYVSIRTNYGQTTQSIAVTR